MRRLLFPILLGALGCAVLVALGAWQLGRMAQKGAQLDRIEARIAGEPGPIPEDPDPERDQYLPVAVEGALGGEEIDVLTSLPGEGPGYRVVSALTAGDRRVLVDLGFVPEEAKDLSRVAEAVRVTGNLMWPREADSWTPAPDEGRGIWFARDVAAMAEALGAEPVLVVARGVEGAELGTVPMPVDASGVPNDHYEYAVTWFGLAAVWAAMSALLIRRTLRRGT